MFDVTGQPVRYTNTSSYFKSDNGIYVKLHSAVTCGCPG